MSTQDTMAPALQTLRECVPLRNLPSDGLREIFEHGNVRDVAAGTTLFKAGDTDDRVLYLLAGQVNLLFGEDGHEIIRANTECSKLPLAPQKPRPATAKTTTDSRLFLASRSLIEVHVGQPSSVKVDEIEIDEDDLQSRLLQQMFDDYVNERVRVPVLPDVALRVREMIQKPDTTLNQIAEIVSLDPSIAAGIVRVANSPACRGVVEVSGCRDAIARLGMKAAGDLVLAMTMSNVFKSSSKLLTKRMNTLRRESARIAALCCVLARESKCVPPDMAMLTGLVHDIGSIAVVAGAESYPELTGRPDALDTAVSALRGQFGSMVLRAWEFPDDIVAGAVEMDAWSRQVERADCCDVVQVARVLNAHDTPTADGMPCLVELPAYLRIFPGETSEERAMTLVAQADSAIREIEEVLFPRG